MKFNITTKHVFTGRVLMLIAISYALVSQTVIGQPVPAAAPQKKTEYSPYLNQNFPTGFTGALRMCIPGYSFDAGMFGITLSPDDLFKVARGGEVVMDNGQRFKQDRPLDWVSITDHAEYMGISDQIRAGSPGTAGQPAGQTLV